MCERTEHYIALNSASRGRFECDAVSVGTVTLHLERGAVEAKQEPLDVALSDWLEHETVSMNLVKEIIC